jgi:hypothetical protein
MLKRKLRPYQGPKVVRNKYLFGGLVEAVQTAQKKVFGRFPRRFRATMDQIGDFVPTDFIIARAPVQKYITDILNVLSFGQFEKLSKKFNFDKYFHLYLIFTVNTGSGPRQYAIEKNETLTLTPYKVREGEERYPIGSSANALTLNEIMEQTIQRVGLDRVVRYNPWTTNCQMFIQDIVQTIGKLTDEANAFIFQEVQKLVAELNPAVADFAEDLTGLAQIGSNLVQEIGFSQGGVVVRPA